MKVILKQTIESLGDEGDVIEVKLGERTLKIKVEQISEHVTKDGAANLYSVLS